MNLRSLMWGAVVVMSGVVVAQNPVSNQAGKETPPVAPKTVKKYPTELVQKGETMFRQDCSFCHGRDATGGESGPDLTRSKLVAQDVGGDKIGAVVRSGRPDKGMPPFNKSDQDIEALVAFIHTQQNVELADRRKGAGGRKGVDVSDLQTGNVDAGKRYFEGACAKCHSASGDLAGVASRYQGLQLEQTMLYPKKSRPKVTVTTASGETVSGKLAYEDEFVVGLTDDGGVYRSWRVRDVKYRVDPGLDGHVELLGKYSDEDVHNLMAYLQTLK